MDGIVRYIGKVSFQIYLVWRYDARLRTERAAGRVTPSYRLDELEEDTAV